MNKFKVGDKVETRCYSEKLDGIWEIVELPKQTDYCRWYLCYQKGFRGHNANGQYPTKEYFYIQEEKLNLYQEDYPVICITTDGKTTIAQKILNGKVVKEASVKLYYKDKFDFEIGCEEALKKLNKVPHLKWLFNGEDIGEIGKPTDQTAIFGEKLFVGDAVEIFDTKTEKTTTPKLLCEDSGTFVMGFGGIKFVNGIDGEYQLRKIKSYKDLKDGEVIGRVKVIK